MFAKALLTSVVFVLPVAGCAHHDHDHDRDREVCVPRERVEYREHHERYDGRYRNSGWHERDDHYR
jgi:hypothetical protein